MVGDSSRAIHNGTGPAMNFRIEVTGILQPRAITAAALRGGPLWAGLTAAGYSLDLRVRA